MSTEMDCILSEVDSASLLAFTCGYICTIGLVIKLESKIVLRYANFNEAVLEICQICDFVFLNVNRLIPWNIPINRDFKGP